MPETTVDEYGELGPWKDKIRTPKKWIPAPPTNNASFAENENQAKLGSSIFR